MTFRSAALDYTLAVLTTAESDNAMLRVTSLTAGLGYKKIGYCDLLTDFDLETAVSPYDNA